MNQPPFGVIFDMDGVIVDSFTMNAKNLATVVADHGHELDIDDLYDRRGLSLVDFLAHLEQRHDQSLPYDPIETALNERQRISHDALSEADAPAGLTELLSSLRDLGVPVALASNNIRYNCTAITGRLGINDHFQVMVTCEDTDQHKPDPTMFLMAAAQLGLPAHRCIVIEDAETGIEAAHRAGMVAIGFTGFLRSSSEPLLPHADRVISSFLELSVGQLRALVRRHAPKL